MGNKEDVKRDVQRIAEEVLDRLLNLISEAKRGGIELTNQDEGLLTFVKNEKSKYSDGSYDLDI